ncbi:response regulator transcription factor [Myceligenerans crystallogenes]|uniref:response regulator transcription factor n=1 Tax=Myceligenerans crystallogenes TaxID=316335 RepID=UPI0031E35623
MTKVLIVDDDSFARSAIRTILTAQGIDVVAEAEDGDEVPDAVIRHRPDVVLIDLQMRRVNGVEAIRRNASRPGAPRFVALTGFGTDDAVVQALQAGAAGFLSKDDDPDDLAARVYAVANGRYALGADAMDTVVQQYTNVSRVPDKTTKAREQLARLTDREREVAAFVHGRTNGQIARQLGISDNTVKVHLSSIMTKLGLQGRDQIALIVDRADSGDGTY